MKNLVAVAVIDVYIAGAGVALAVHRKFNYYVYVCTYIIATLFWTRLIVCWTWDSNLRYVVSSSKTACHRLERGRQ